MLEETFFRFAYDEYKKANNYIERFWEVLDSGNDANLIKSKHQFDSLIQGMLLRNAAFYGSINHTQIDFIRSIADTGDVLNFVRFFSKGELDLSWEFLPLLEQDTLTDFAKLLELQLAVLAEHFFEPFAYLDSVTGKDTYNSLFKDVIMGIASSFDYLIDKPVTEPSIETLLKDLEFARIFTCFEKSWSKKKEEAVEKQKNEEDNSNKKEGIFKSRFKHLKDK